MKREKKTLVSNLSPDVAAACRRLGTRKQVGALIKTVLFWAIALTALFITESQNDFFTREKQPFWFSVVLLLFVAFPVWKWKPYRLLTVRDFRGTIVSYQNKRCLETPDRTARGVFVSPRLMDTMDVYIIKVIAESGKKRTFTVKGDGTRFGRFYYQKGDVVTCPRFAKFPFNETRPLPAPYCLYCGTIGSVNETVCSFCGAPFALVPEEGQFVPAESELVLPATDAPDQSNSADT